MNIFIAQTRKTVKELKFKEILPIINNCGPSSAKNPLRHVQSPGYDSNMERERNDVKFIAEKIIQTLSTVLRLTSLLCLIKYAIENNLRRHKINQKFDSFQLTKMMSSQCHKIFRR